MVVGSSDYHQFVLPSRSSVHRTSVAADDAMIPHKHNPAQRFERPRSAPAAGRRPSEHALSLRASLIRKQKQAQPIGKVQQEQERLAAELLRKQRAATAQQRHAEPSTQQEVVLQVGTQVPALRHYCRNYDKARSGLVTWTEFRSALARVGVQLPDERIHDLANRHMSGHMIDFEVTRAARLHPGGA